MEYGECRIVREAARPLLCLVAGGGDGYMADQEYVVRRSEGCPAGSRKASQLNL